MQYEKPAVVELGSRAARGDEPMACLAGGGVAFIACAAGTTDSACYTGAGGYETGSDCMPGTAAAGGSCLPGGGNSYECAGGSGATYPGTCTVGPSA